MTDFDSNREWANNISEILEHSTKESLLDYLEKLEKKWKIPTNINDIFSKILQNFSIKSVTSVDMAIIEIEYNKHQLVQPDRSMPSDEEIEDDLKDEYEAEQERNLHIIHNNTNYLI